MFVAIGGLTGCTSPPGVLDVQFARAVALKTEALPSNSSVYQAQVLPELLDSYGAKVVFGNLWGRLASSPDHWFKLGPGSHGEDFKFSEEVVRRRTELQMAADYYTVTNLGTETVMELV